MKRRQLKGDSQKETVKRRHLKETVKKETAEGTASRITLGGAVAAQRSQQERQTLCNAETNKILQTHTNPKP